jgi:DNA replication and repair protein RecF
LIDDIGAELDMYSRTALSSAIEVLDCQVVITAIDKEVLEPFFKRFIFDGDIKSTIDNDSAIEENTEYYKMFHVKHGEITEMYPDDSDLNIRKAIE